MELLNNLYLFKIMSKIILGDNMLSDKKKVYSIILEKEIKEKIDKIATEEDRSSSSMINFILKKYINELDKKY